MRARRLSTEEEARAYLRALGHSSAFVEGGRPPLDRCDGGRWGDPQIRQGAHCAPCVCTSRALPDPSCPYATHQASPAYYSPTTATYLVQLVEGYCGQEGERRLGINLSPTLGEDIAEGERATLELLEVE